jgi:hypothetical protein
MMGVLEVSLGWWVDGGWMIGVLEVSLGWWMDDVGLGGFIGMMDP